MNDQACQLRQLVIRDALDSEPRPDQADRPFRLTRVVLLSGRSGAGTSTIGSNVALALARLGARTLLVTRGAPSGWQETFQPIVAESDGRLDGNLSMGPFGLGLLSGHHGWPLANEQAVERLADFVLIDVGQATDWGPLDAEVALYIMTLDNASILDTYMRMKSQPAGETGLVIANRVEVESEGWTAVKRFCAASDDYTHRRLIPAAVIPDDASGQLSAASPPVVLQSPTGPLAKRFEAVAERLMELRGCQQRFVSNRPVA